MFFSVPRPRATRTARLNWLSAYAMFSSLAEPQDSVGIVGLAVHALGIEDGEIVHGFGVAFGRRSHIKFLRGGQVLSDALSFFEHARIAELRRCKAFARGALEPFGRLFKICGYASSFHEAHGYFIGRGRITGGRRIAQTRSADGGGQTICRRWLRDWSARPRCSAICRCSRDRAGDLTFCRRRRPCRRSIQQRRTQQRGQASSIQRIQE